MTIRRAEEALPPNIEIVAGLVASCDVCGVPCTGTFRLWYVEGGKRMTFEVDRPTFWELLEPAVKAAIDEGAYPAMPAFIRNWNEAVGWAGQGLDEATPVDTADILATIETLKARHDGADTRLAGVIASLGDFVLRCFDEDRALWAGET